MIKEIQNITDRSSFENICKKFFLKRSVYLKHEDRNIQVNFIKYDKGLIAIAIPRNFQLPVKNIIFTRVQQTLVCAIVSMVKQDEMLTYFNPSMIQIITSPRQDTRETLSPDREKIAFATNIIADHIIAESLLAAREKTDRIKESIKFDDQKPFDFLKIYFADHGYSDQRMQFFLKEKKPLFIPSFSSRSGREQGKLLDFYLKNIYEHDTYLKSQPRYVSEVSVPILFQSKIPYGYIQANDTVPFHKTMVPMVKRLAHHVEDLSIKHRIFTASEQAIPVSDVSQKGLGIVFRDSSLLNYYRQNSYVAFDMILPRHKKASLLADVRHIDILDNNIIKVGFQIKDMDESSQENYQRFLRIVKI